ncbi:S8 family serine peptidase [Catenulispora sp. GAS73]|uniref:S8 family serine peptidase n=1 Tax=Catenulispora sp. GAS73 TaxID=3156269 RepID=UPI0035149263
MGAASASAAPSTTVGLPVIVVMASHAADRAAADSAQAPLLRSLKSSGGRNVRSLSVINALSATVSPAEEQVLRSDPNVAEVVPDAAIKVRSGLTLPGLPSAVAKGAAKGGGPARAASVTLPTLPSGTCAANGGVQLDPEALESIKADSDVPGAKTARSLGYTGAGVTVGDIAAEMDVNTPDLIRPDGSHVIADYQDFTGEGGTVFAGNEIESLLDDGMIAAQGDHVYNLQDYTSSALGKPCLIRLEGVAPGVTLDAYKVYGENDLTTTSAFLEAIDHAVTVDHVNVLNEEAGSFPMPDTSADLIKAANAAAMAAGVTITVPSYDAGNQNTIWSPASQPGVIAVGASTTFRSYAQADSNGYDDIGATGYVSDNISSLSSGGATEQGRSISVVAPGDLDWMICTADKTIAPDCLNTLRKPSPVLQEGGTSEAGPLVAGVAALVIQAYRAGHAGASPTPALVDQLIESTADDLDVVGSEQGSGLVDAYRAVEAAKSVHTPDGNGAASGNTLMMSADQFDATAAPGTVQHFTTSLTNTGTSTQTVSLAGRTLSPIDVVANRTARLANGGSTYVDQSGVTNNYVKVTFQVPPGQDRLDSNIAWPGVQQDPVNLVLLDPSGKFTANSLPNGNGNHGHVDVHNPVPGTWTAVISDDNTASGYTGKVLFNAAVSRFVPFGQVSPSTVTLRPGQSMNIAVSAKTPARAGDLSASLAISSPQSGRSSIPMTLRSVVATNGGVGVFSSDIQGGNGRGGVPAQSEFFVVNVPAGKPALDVRTVLAGHRTDPYFVYLVSPDGQNPARASNITLEGSGASQHTVASPGAQLSVLTPQAGQWTIIVTFTNPVTGDALDTTFDGEVDFHGVGAVAGGVPQGGVIAAGKPVTMSFTVHNSSQGIESYFLDPRLDQYVTMPLASTTPSANLTLPLSSVAPVPQWIVPTRTSQLSTAVTSTAPVQFDSSPFNGEPDVGSTAVGDDAFASYQAPRLGGSVTQGDWDVVPQPSGAFGGTSGTANSTATVSMTAVSQAFNADAVSNTGDLWQLGVNPNAAFTPVVVQPGGEATLTLTVTPSQAAGSAVSGVVYLDDSKALSNNGPSPTGDELAAFPYHYTVK